MDRLADMYVVGVGTGHSGVVVDMVVVDAAVEEVLRRILRADLVAETALLLLLARHTGLTADEHLLVEVVVGDRPCE